MTDTKVFNIASQPGIYRDWTLNSSPGWTRGEYTRFFEGRPKKIGGWRQIGSIGLTPNNTPFSASGLEPDTGEPNLLTMGNIRKLLTYPVDGRYVVVVAADVLGVLEDVSPNINPNNVLFPSGLFIGLTDNNFVLPIKFYPIRFQRYFVQNGDTQTQVTFIPGEYSWCLSIYGVSSGGQTAIPNIQPNIAAAELSSLALVAQASPSLNNKSSTRENYVFFGLLSDIFNFDNEDNYVLDPCLTRFPELITSATLPANTTWTSVTWGNNLFVAVASGGMIAATSPDGITWTQRSLGVSDTWVSVTYGRGYFVAIPSSGTAGVKSLDGITWTPFTFSPTTSTWSAIIFGRGLFVAITANGTRVAASADSIVWFPGVLPTATNWSAVASDGTGFIAVSRTGGYAAASLDGITWVAQDLGVDLSWVSITYGAGRFVALSTIGTTAVTTLGGLWTYGGAITGVAAVWSAITYGNGLFVAVANGASTIAVSTYGFTWTLMTFTPAAALVAIVSTGDDDGLFVAIATGSTVALDIYPAKSQNVKYVYSPWMYPITQQPVGGITVFDPSNPYVYPQTNDPQAIWATSEVYVSGGVQAVGPFLVAYSNNGLVRNCSSNSPNVWFNNGNVYYNQNPLLANDNNIDNYKVVKVATMRTGSQLSFMIWTTNTLSVASFCGAPGVFSYATISFSSSIMSAMSVIEHNGIFYWVGEDKFYQCDGNTLTAMPNNANLIWFFNNLTYSARAKTWAYKNPRYNEIWFVFPYAGSTEPNHAVVFDYVSQTWYDTPWNRTAGYFDQSFYRPILCGGSVALDSAFLTQLPDDIESPMPWQTLLGANPMGPAIWMHEIGVDEVSYPSPDNPLTQPIPAFIESGNVGYTNGGINSPVGQGTEGLNSKTFVARIESDIIGSGTNYVAVLGQDYPLSEQTQLFYSAFDLPASYFSPDVQGRLLTIRFGCNALDSTFWLGKAIVTAKPGDDRS